MATSVDRVIWSIPIKAFSDPIAAANPVVCNQSCMQWQPNLVLLDGGRRLGCAWSQGWSQGPELDGCFADRTYWSVMDAAPASGGRWESRVLTFEDGGYHKLFDGRHWQVFPTQNPTYLRSGRLLVPVILIDNHVTTGGRRASVLISDDEGATFQVSNGTVALSTPGTHHSVDPQWETTVWEPTSSNNSKSVWMFDHFNNASDTSHGGPAPDERLQYARSVAEPSWLQRTVAIYNTINLHPKKN